VGALVRARAYRPVYAERADSAPQR